MSASYDAFLERFPEFKPGGTAPQQAATQAVIERELLAAALEVNTDYWGDHALTGVQLLAAHRVVIKPGGQFARFASKDGNSTYGKEYQRMRDQILVGDRVP